MYDNSDKQLTKEEYVSKWTKLLTDNEMTRLHSVIVYNNVISNNNYKQYEGTEFYKACEEYKMYVDKKDYSQGPLALSNAYDKYMEILCNNYTIEFE